ncbi:DsbA family protein [Parasulfitobacter algicola]|uniref:DsbA family protein n=1 Tax=Parasulfitobacter algicola TaxID=2614809 RepID=A0ABX2ITX5_9RHOB|nr:DsbA family protein [Sulfitobacter algicola]NSX55775.1 DsbA family protein [Sulfitobacter algicola]
MKSLFAYILALSVAASPLAAVDLDDMTDEQREIFRSEVRSYLLEHPEVLNEAIEALQSRQRVAQAEQDKTNIQDNADAIFNDGYSWVGGNPDGDITLVEFTDYRCGFCRRAHSEVNELIESDGNIRFIVKEFPILGEQSELSSRFAIAALQLGGPNTYKAAHDALITMRGDLNAVAIQRLAATLGLDAAEVTDRMASDEVSAVINENRALAQSMGISGTPTFILKNEMLRGYVPLNDMRLIVEDVRTN